MTLVALANAVFGDRMVERFHADPRVQATELLLQERVPRQRPTTEPRPLDEMRVSPPHARRAGPPLPDAPHGVSAHAVPVERQSTSRASPTPAAARAPARAWRSPARGTIPRATHGSQFLYLRDVRSGAVWSPTYHPTRLDAEDYTAVFLPEKATFAPPRR